MPFNFRKKNYTYTYKDLYRLYRSKKMKSGFKRRDVIRETQYVPFITDFFLMVCQKIVREGFIFVLPYRLGCIYMKNYKPKNKVIDWANTLKYNKRVYFSLSNTFGKLYYIHWLKDHVIFRNKNIYSFNFMSSPHARARSAGKKSITDFLNETSKDPLSKPIRDL